MTEAISANKKVELPEIAIKGEPGEHSTSLKTKIFASKNQNRLNEKEYHTDDDGCEIEVSQYKNCKGVMEESVNGNGEKNINAKNGLDQNGLCQNEVLENEESHGETDEANNHNLGASSEKGYGFLVDTLTWTGNEIYNLCLDKLDSSLVQDITSLLQKLTYEFVALEEWIKLKDLVKELPLPERKNSLPPRNNDPLDTQKNIESNYNADTNPSEDHSEAPPSSQSAINALAPDFVPASFHAYEKLIATEDVKTFMTPEGTSLEYKHYVPDWQNGSSNDWTHCRGSPYFKNPEEYELPNTCPVQSYEPYNSSFFDSPSYQSPYSNLFSYSPTYAQTISTQYISPFPVQYPLFPQDFRAGMMGVNRPSHYYHGMPYNSHPRKHSHKTFKKSTSNQIKHSPKIDEISDEQILDKKASLPSKHIVPALNAETKKTDNTDVPSIDINKNIALSIDKKTPQPDKTKSSSVWPDPCTLAKNKKIGGNNIFGLPADQGLIHFPELTSGCSKKNKNRWSSSTTAKGTLQPKQSLTSDNKAVISEPLENYDEKTPFSFSEVMKISRQPVERAQQPPSSSNSSATLKSKVKTWTGSCSAPEKRAFIKKSTEEWLDESIHVVPESLKGEEHTDSDGWELVKTRSKWRDNSEAKGLRQHLNKTNKWPSYKAPRSHQVPNSHPFGSILFENRKNNTQSGLDNSLNNASANENQISGIHQDHHSGSLSVVTTEIACGSTNDLTADNLSSETSHEVSVNQSEGTSPADSKYMEKIDPNEVYSAYMKYLSITSCNPASLEEMTDFVNKDPVRALDFKNKLADKIKHQEDVKRKNEAKQQLALKKRLQFLHDKTAKFRGLVEKVKEVKAAQDQLALQRKNRLDQKLKKAEEKRKMHLNIIKRKAHDEEEKLKEIAFINELEAQNRRHDSLALRQEHEERLQCLVEERQRKLEEKAAKEAAVEERRKALEAERKERLELMRERRRRKEEFIDKKQQEKENKRLVIAREKAREREERLHAIHTAQLANVEELQKRIQQKQEESQKRHIECIELIRQKAIEIGLHRNNADNSSSHLTLYPKGDCVLSHKAAPNPQSLPQDKYKIHLKKRLKKIKSRMNMRGSHYIEKTHNDDTKELVQKETCIQKVMKKLMTCELDKTFIWKDEDIESVDHCLDEILLCLQEEPSLCEELKNMKAFIFFESVISTFNHSCYEKVSGQSLRCIIKVITVYDLSCLESPEICIYILLSNILAPLLDSLRFSLQALKLPSKSWALIVELLLRFHSIVIDGLNLLPDEILSNIPDFSIRMKDVIGYILCSGLVNKITDLFRQTILDDKLSCESLLLPSILFFRRLLCSWFISDELINALKSTDLFGTVPLLYEGLIKQITDNDSLPDYCEPTIKLFLKLAEVNLTAFQEILGAENIALQWRGIASGLMTYCVSKTETEGLLNMVIKLVGYFAIHNKKNQTLLQSGKQPTVLQQLVKLPFQYFCHPDYMEFLFPTLISCSFNNATNRAIVESEVGYSGLEKFMKSEKGKNNNIIKLLLESENK